jgi:hypothetical protein
MSGLGFDTTISKLIDTSLSLNVMGRLKVASVYRWTVSVSDGKSVVASSDTFKFRTSDEISSVDKQQFVPKEFVLEQNYPNPFNPSTTIIYHLPDGQAGQSAASFVRLKIFDMLGKEVAVLVNGKQSPREIHRSLECDWISKRCVLLSIDGRKSYSDQENAIVAIRNIDLPTNLSPVRDIILDGTFHY